MSPRPEKFLPGLLIVLLCLSACSESQEMVPAKPKQTITLRAASAVVENSIPFSSYVGASVDVIVNGGSIQTFSNQSSPDWTVEVEDVILDEENSLIVEWYILHDSERYDVARQSGSFLADPQVAAAEFNAPHESESYDHDNDSVSNLIEVNAGGFPVSADVIPEVIDIVTPGEFTIGASAEEIETLGYENERATRTAIANNYSIGKFEVTYAQFETYANAIAAALPNDNDWDGGDLPVTNVTWSEAYAYTAWLSKITGDQYRLPTEAEWEYAARAGSEMTYTSGETITSHNANFATPVLDAYFYQNGTLDDPGIISGVFRLDNMGTWREYKFDDGSEDERLFATFTEIRRDTNGIWIYDSS